MIQRRFFFVSVFLALLIVTAPLYWPGSVPKVSPGSLMTLISDGEIPTILDVRTALEYDIEHIPHAQHTPLTTIFFAHDDLAISRQKDLIVYCGTGLRARIASAYLKLVGFNSVYMLDGQFKGWKKGGYAFVVS